ncbi:MAG: hypothetical protein HOK49_13485 [Opitutae bacterium]|nr:hypothetical protein [Opitutae bacterium]
MKNTPRTHNWCLLLCSLLFVTNQSLNGLDYQTLTNPAGNTIEAHIWKVVGNEVFLELRNGRKIKTEVSNFSAASQTKLRNFGKPPPPPPVATPPPTSLPAPNPFGNLPSVTNSPPSTTTTFTPPTTSLAPPISGTGLPVGAPPPAFTQTPPPVNSGGRVDLTAVLQESAAIIGSIDFAKMQESAFFEANKSMIPSNEDGQGEKILGMAMTDITGIAFSMKSLDDFNMDIFSGDPSKVPESMQFAAAITFSKNMDMQVAKEEMLKDEGSKPEFSDFAGAILATPKPGDTGVPQNLCLALKNQGNSSIVLIGSRNIIESTLNNGQAKNVTGDARVFANLPSERDMWLTVALPPELTSKISKEATADKENPQAAMFAAMIQKFEAIGLAVDLEESAKINLFAQCKDAQSANQISSAINGIVTMAKMAKNPAETSKTPAFLNTLTITPQDNMVSASIQISQDDIKNLTKGLMNISGAETEGSDFGGPSNVSIQENNSSPPNGKPMPFPGATSTQTNNPFGATTPPNPTGTFPPPPQMVEKPPPAQTKSPNSGDPFAN